MPTARVGAAVQLAEQVQAGATATPAFRQAQVVCKAEHEVQIVDLLGQAQGAEAVGDRVARLDSVEILEKPGAARKHHVAVVLGLEQALVFGLQRTDTTMRLVKLGLELFQASRLNLGCGRILHRMVMTSSIASVHRDRRSLQCRVGATSIASMRSSSRPSSMTRLVAPSSWLAGTRNTPRSSLL